MKFQADRNRIKRSIRESDFIADPHCEIFPDTELSGVRLIV
jgi:hypothetical protein